MNIVTQRRILPIALVAILSSACLVPGPIATPGAIPATVERIPDVVERFDGNVTEAVDTALRYLRLAVNKEREAARGYLAVAPLMPASIDKQIRQGFIGVSELIIGAVDALERGVTAWAQVRDLLQPIVTAMNSLNDWIRIVRPVQPGAAVSGDASSWRSLAGELTGMVAKAALQKVLR